MATPQYKLCYVDKNVLYFTDNFENQWGDDWNDAPYEHNAGEPYEVTLDNPVREGYGHIKLIAHEDDWHIKRPCDGCLNSQWSVEDINKGAVPWLYCEEAGPLMAGATMAKAKKWLTQVGVKWGELKSHK